MNAWKRWGQAAHSFYSVHTAIIRKPATRVACKQDFKRFAEVAKVYLVPVHVTCMTNPPSALDIMYLSLTQISECGSSGTNCQNGT